MRGPFTTAVVFVAIAGACSSYSSSEDPDAGVGGDAAASDAAVATTDGNAADAAPDVNTYAAAVLADQPIAYLRLEETKGSNARDERSATGGLFSGNVELGVAGAFDGSVGIALDGSVGGVVLGPVVDTSGRRPFSVELWYAEPVRPDAGAPNEYRFLVSRNQFVSSTRESLHLWVHPTNGLTGGRYVADAGAAPGLIEVNTPRPTVGAYHHVVFTYDGAKQNLFQDGVQAGSLDDTREATASSASFWFGDFGPSPVYLNFLPLIGSLDEIAVYDKALTAERVAAHYAAAPK